MSKLRFSCSDELFGGKFFLKIWKIACVLRWNGTFGYQMEFLRKNKYFRKEVKYKFKDSEWKFQGYLAKKLNWFVIIALYLSTRHFWWKTSYGLFSANVFAAFESKCLDFWSRPLGFVFKTALSVRTWNVTGKTKNLPFFLFVFRFWAKNFLIPAKKLWQGFQICVLGV